MLTSQEEIKSFSKECFSGLTDMLGVSLKPPKLNIKPINHRADDMLNFIDAETKALRSYYRHLDRAFQTGVPERNLIAAQAENSVIRKYFLADYDQRKDKLLVSLFPTAASLECFNRKLSLRPVRASKLDAEQYSDSLKEAISGQLMRAARAKAIGYAKKEECPDRLLVTQRLDDMVATNFDDLYDREYRYHMRRNGYQLRAILDNRDFFEALGCLLGPRAVKSKEFKYKPSLNHENVQSIRDALIQKSALEISAQESSVQYDPCLHVMSDICFTSYLGGNGFMKRQVYNKEDPIIKRAPGDIYLDFF